MLNNHSKASVAQVVFYFPALIAAIVLLFFRPATRALPRYQWFVLVLFTLIRFSGGIVLILYENNPSSTGLLIATLILLNAGVFPCIAATIGLLNIITHVDFSHNKRLDMIIVSSRLIFLAGIVLLVAGGSLEGNYSKPGDEKSGTALIRAGYIVIAVFVGFLLALQIFFWLRRSQLSPLSKLVLRGTTLAMPFFIVRLTYAFLSIYQSNETWNSLTGPVAPYIAMALVMEYCVVLIYLYTGFRLQLPKIEPTGVTV